MYRRRHNYDATTGDAWEATNTSQILVFADR
jgi:hypothetical protein